MTGQEAKTILLTERLAADPAATMRCLNHRCRREYPLNGPAGPSWRCHHCGHEEPADDVWHGSLRCWREGQEARDKLAAAREAEESAAAIAEWKAATAGPGGREHAPPGLDDVIGNADAVAELRLALDAHLYRQAKAGDKLAKFLPLPHLLLCGPGGTGKSMLARIVSRELGRTFHLQTGDTLSNPIKVCEVLLSLKAGDVLFVDEIHELKVQCQEAFYLAMEDGVLVPPTRAGKEVVKKPIRLPPFTLIGATTDEWSLMESFGQRFKYRIGLQRLTPDELAEALTQRAARLGWTVEPEAMRMIGGRSLGTPRLGVSLLDGCMDAAQAQGHQNITVDMVLLACKVKGIDSLGLGRTSRQYLGFLRDAGGGPVRLNVLASKLDGLAKSTVERKLECDLVWLGLIEKSATGRVLTKAGREHLQKGT